LHSETGELPLDSSAAIAVAIVAAAPALRSGLGALLQADERLQVVSEAATLLDLRETGDLGVLICVPEPHTTEEFVRGLGGNELPAIVLLSEDPEAAQVLAALPLPGWGLLPMEASEEEIIATVHAVHNGLIAAAPQLLQLNSLQGGSPPGSEVLEEELTARELDVLQLLAQGFPNKQIAMQLEISEHTVKFHSSAIYAKLGVTNRTEAVRRGARLGLISL
jgi:DNA-binding NarL/FixJ family response regulator